MSFTQRSLSVILSFFLLTGFQKDLGKASRQPSGKKQSPAKEDIFPALRDLALTMTPEQLGIDVTSKSEVYGVVMDWELTDGIATVTSFKTGDASVYLSSGGGHIGGVQDENINRAAKILVRQAQPFLSRTIPTKTHPLPDKNCVRFYLVTTGGLYTSQVPMKTIENETSPWFPLFISANRIITEYFKPKEK